MTVLTYLDQTYECAVALKGDDYIHLLDENGCMTYSFEGITDFSAFELVEGEWTLPTPETNCHLAVIGDDGTVKKSPYKCSDKADRKDLAAVEVTFLASGWSATAPYTQTVQVEGMTVDWIPGIPTLVSSFDVETDLGMLDALSYVNLITSANGSLTFTCYEYAPTVDFTVRVPGMIGG